MKIDFTLEQINDIIRLINSYGQVHTFNLADALEKFEKMRSLLIIEELKKAPIGYKFTIRSGQYAGTWILAEVSKNVSPDLCLWVNTDNGMTRPNWICFSEYI